MLKILFSIFARENKKKIVTRIAATFFYLLILQAAAQQSYNAVLSTRSAYANKLIAVNGNFCSVHYDDNPYTSIQCRTSAGSLVFSKSLQLDGSTRVTDFIPVSGPGILLVGLATGCDHDHPLSSFFMVKLDMSGNVVFQTTVTPMSFMGMAHGAQMDDGTFVVSVHDSLFRFSSQGTFMWSGPTAVSNVTEMTDLPGKKLLLSGTHQNSLRHCIVDTAGIVKASIPGSAFKYAKTGDGKIVALDNNRLEVFMPDLSSMKHLITSYFVDMDVDNDQIFCITPNHEYSVFDTTFATLHTFTLSHSLRQCAAIAVNASQAAFLSNCKPAFWQNNNPEPGLYTAITAFPRSQGWNYPYDIEVTAVSCDSCAPTAHYVANAGFSYISMFLRLNVTVKNHSADTIKSFYLTNSKRRPGFCDLFYLQDKINVAIPPGGTVQVQTAPANFDAFSSVAGPVTSPVTIVGDFTIAATAPEHQIDHITSNDISTLTFTTVVTDLHGQVALLPTFSAFPNPVSDWLRIESPATITSVSLFSADGRLILKQQLHRNTDAIDVRMLQPGIYMASFESNESTFIKRVVVSR